MCSVKIGRIGKFDLNPRGNLWLKDENRFGHKLLSKMGWSQGKGLGKNESGITENLKVRMKMGNTGVGWDEKLPIAIDYRDCDAVLDDLAKRYQKASETRSEDTSLEKRSQQFKNRIHYQKFVRGKDTSRYSEKDMNCIFLSRKSEMEMEPTPKEATVTNIESRPTEISSKESVPTFNSQLTIGDYFAMKMKNKIGNPITPKDSKSCKEFSEPDSEVRSKKRKQESKKSKKAKRVKLESESSAVDKKPSYEEDTSESSSSSLGTSEANTGSKEILQDAEESFNCENLKRKKRLNKKARKLLNGFKSDPNVDGNIGNNFIKENNIIQENCPETVKLFKGTSNSSDGSNNIVNVEVTSKSKKRQQKRSQKLKKCQSEGTEIFTNVEKNSPHTDSDNADEDVKSQKVEKQSDKESKRHKKHTISNLKSCLKSCLSNKKYNLKPNLKEVSFNENISYKIIENVLDNFNSDIVLETNEQLLSCSDEDCADDKALSETKTLESNHVETSTSSNSDEEFSEELELKTASSLENPMITNMVEESEVPECFQLPKCSSTNYNSWLETQRIAARMKIYKNMAKKIKRHPVLRKTNMLKIKGYGNWGF